MANNEVRDGFKADARKLFSAVDAVKRDINAVAWKNAPLGSDLGFGRSFTAKIREASYRLAQPIQKLGAPIQTLAAPVQKFSTLVSEIKSIERLGTFEGQIKNFQNDLSRRHDLTKPLGASNFCCEPLNKVSLATKNLKDYEDRFNLMRGGLGNLYSRI